MSRGKLQRKIAVEEAREGPLCTYLARQYAKRLRDLRLHGKVKRKSA